MSGTLSVLALVFLFIAIGAFFAAAEIALVSLREGQVRSLGQRGQPRPPGRQAAEDPNRFLAAVQVGVTLAGFLSAAFGASSLAEDMAPEPRRRGVPEGWPSRLPWWSSPCVITYLSIVFSELVPKRLALQHAERTSLWSRRSSTASRGVPAAHLAPVDARPTPSCGCSAATRTRSGSRSRRRSCATSSPATSSSAARSAS